MIVDGAGGPKVAIVNQALARQYFGDRSAIGARVVSKDGTIYEIIAVVGDAKYLELRETVPRLSVRLSPSLLAG